MAAAFFTYMLECADGSFYTGWTDNIERRVAVHNDGNGGHYTRSHRPVKLVASWSFATKNEAMSCEWHIKQLPKPKKLALVQGRLSIDSVMP